MKHSFVSKGSELLAVLSLAATPLVFSANAAAETSTEAKSQGAEAARRAQAAYDVQDWPTAIREYRAAYQAEQRPELLWGLAQALRMSGDCRSAILSYKAYRRADVSANQGTAAELMITRCEAELMKRDAEAAKAATPEQPAAAAQPAPAPATSQEAPKPAAPPPAPEGPKKFYEDALGDILLVAGVAAAGVGGYFLMKGNSQVSDGNGASTYGSHTDGVDDGKKKQTLGVITLAAGGALLAGATLRFLTFDPGPHEKVSIGLDGIHFRTQF